MFRRRSSSRHQPLNTTPSASAQTAASKAFSASRDASPSLSSAAAAAALRSHTPPPTSVGSVQTKRMLQRQLSNSSRGSSSGGLRHGSQPTLRRTPSSGSMTSRTFRESSPGRPQTNSSIGSSHPPPVPPLPRTMTPRRSVSVQPAQLNRGAPSHIQSRNGRVASLDRTTTASPDSPRNSFVKPSSPDIDRPGSRTSVNFSYPMSARPNSPPQSPMQPTTRQDSSEQSPGPTLSPSETASIQHSIDMAASRKVKTKPQTAAPGSIEGNHLAHKTMGSRPTGTALQDTTEYYKKQAQAEQAEIHQPVPVTEEPPYSPVTSEDGVQAFDSANLRPQPKKRPSMVMEDNEGEELAEAAEAVQQQAPIAESLSTHEHHLPDPENVYKSHTTRDTPVMHLLQTNHTVVNPQTRLSPSTSSAPSSPGGSLSVDNNIANQQFPERQPSISPHRSARFSAQLTVSSSSPMHEPPPRSISPAKPALKISSSPDRRTQLGRPPSEFSDGTSVASDDGSRTGSKKKTVKVSFDDEAEIVGVAASPPTSPEPMNRPLSPVEKLKTKKWFGIGTKKALTKDVAGDDDFESFLRPRPALPSFGSIRGVKSEDAPTATAAYDDESDSSSDDDSKPSGLGVSNDHAIADILVNAHQREYENTPQQVRSKPTGESSPSEVESPTVAVDDEIPKAPIESRMSDGAMVNHILPTVPEEQGSTPPANSTEISITEIPEVIAEEAAENQQATAVKEPVPVIAIQPATPGEDQRRSIDLRDMPGGFPSLVSEGQTQQNPSSPKGSLVQSFKEFDPLVQEVDSDEDNSGESIYSDAAEDPTEFQGDVFGSINAIVDSPVPKDSQLPTEVPDSPTRAKIRSDPLAKMTESVPSPSLEAINPRMPATPPSAPHVPSSHAVSSQQQPISGPVSSSWPLKSDANSISSSPVQPKSKNMPRTSPQGPQLRNVPAKLDGQQQQSSNKAASSSTFTKSKRASTAEVRGNAPSRRQDVKSLPQSMTYPAGLAKMRSDDSDSDSSFRRTRRSSRPATGGQFSMKRTMRASTSNSNTFAERSTPARASSMRTTMRGPPPERPSGFGSLRDKSGRARPRSTLTPNTRTRLGDSDDEGGGGGRRLFQSRFADSSDEDEPLNNLTPVRGIPRRQGKYDGESTDLDDSSDDEARRQIRKGAIRTAQHMTPEDIDRILSQPKKKGLFARLRSPTRSGGKDGKVQKSRIESPARRDTPLERSRSELAAVHGHGSDTYSSRPLSPKLQKKQKSAFNDTWPLSSEQSSAYTAEPRPITNATQDRPSTSDGIVNSSNAKKYTDGSGLHPNINRHGTSDSIDSSVTSAASEVVVGRTGKKKRFPLLRKAFGLRD